MRNAKRDETVIIHSIANETALRVGYPATVSVYQRDGAYHYAASVGVTDEPNGSKRAAGREHSHQGGPGYQTVREAMAAGWRYIDGHWLGRAAMVIGVQDTAQEMVRGLLHGLGYVGDQFESPVAWHCRGCEAEVSPEGKVEHTQYCVVGKAELSIAGDVFYEPPAGDVGLEEFFTG